jgi:hypothetical protein
MNRGVALCLAGIGLVLLVWKIQSVEAPRPAAQAAAEKPIREICHADTDAAMAANLIYKIEGNYMVYVQPVWYEMPFDWKRGAAAYIAECR